LYANEIQVHELYADRARVGVGHEKRSAPGQGRRGNLNNGHKMDWFLKRVFLIWLFLTAVIIAAVLQMIHESGGFN
jgi:hypothetical protein